MFNRSLLKVHRNKPDCHVPSKFTNDNPELNELIYKFGKQICKIPFKSVQVNKDYVCQRHIDKNNRGLSTIVGLGDYEGGNLFIEKEDGIEKINIRNNPIEFDGSKFYHYNDEITSGTRYSLVFFNV